MLLDVAIVRHSAIPIFRLLCSAFQCLGPSVLLELRPSHFHKWATSVYAPAQISCPTPGNSPCLQSEVLASCPGVASSQGVWQPHHRVHSGKWEACAVDMQFSLMAITRTTTEEHHSSSVRLGIFTFQYTCGTPAKHSGLSLTKPYRVPLYGASSSNDWKSNFLSSSRSC